MNIVYNVRTVIGGMLFMILVGIPRVLNNLGLELGAASFMLDMWWIFVVVLFSISLIFYQYLRNWRYTLIMFLFSIAIAYVVAIAW